ncbi:MAG: hypothetical protein FJW20_12800 [Acidimicrobiia bacterium]|nr:hypothetical protein [Acidimicrobiia bacterium]
MHRWLALAVFSCLALAHVGSPDVFHEGKAGPYTAFVTIRPPLVIPGVAEIEIRVSEPGIEKVRITPMPLTGDGAKFAPTPDIAERSKDDTQFFTGSLWMMTSGSWQVRVHLDGSRGSGKLSVPVPAIARKTQAMDLAMAAMLTALMLLLSAGIVSIVGAASRESQLEPGLQPDPGRLKRARRMMIIAAVTVVAILYLGNLWWTAEASAYDRYIYKPLEMDATLEQSERLVLKLRDPGWLPRLLDDFLPDHNHLMHMYVIRLPEMERVWHLHPEMTASGVFEHKLPPMPAGRYRLYSDVVHKSGFPETIVAEIELPEIAGKPIEGDDSTGVGPKLSASNRDLAVAGLEDGYRMIWERDPKGYPARKPAVFRFRIEDEKGEPAEGMELYMGMPGHAAFLKHDGTVFAHVHPSGSVPMASLSLTSAEADPHAGHARGVLSPEAGFPYGFPSPGHYRIIVQMKLAGKVRAGMFDLNVN